MHRPSLAFALTLLAPPALYAAPPDQSRFAVWAGPLNVMVMTATIDVEPQRYTISVAYRTAGAFGLIVHNQMDSAASGRFVNGRAEPSQFFAAGRLRGGERVTQLDYPRGEPEIRQLVPANDDRDPVPAAQQAGTIDTLSAMAQLVRQVNLTGRCDGRLTTFDGRRLTEIEARTAGLQELPPSSRSAFSGQALRCDVVGHQLAGYKHDATEAEMHRPQEGSAWFARLAPDGPMTLVRAAFKTPFFGQATLYLQPAP